MNRSRLREFQQYNYQEPKQILLALREVKIEAAASNLDSKVKQLRTNKLKECREVREAAIFCYGMMQRINIPIYLSCGESQDYDFIGSWVADNEQNFAPVQLKEVVPATINASSSIENIINSLAAKYVDSEDLTVAIHLNRQIHFDPKTLIIPHLRIAGLWIFGSISPDQSEWGLWGNFLEQPEGSRFTYPA